MKPLGIVLSLVGMAISGCAAPQRGTSDIQHVPFFEVKGEETSVAQFERNAKASQPWLRGKMEAPLTMEDLGLTQPVRIISYDMYLDGGTQVYVFGDQQDHFFAFCTTRPGDRSPAFYLGVTHPSDPVKLTVHMGSESYRFLYLQLWSFASDPRYRPSPESIREVSKAEHMSEEEVERYLGKPNQSTDPTLASGTPPAGQEARHP
jgi:hypothetical protein